MTARLVRRFVRHALLPSLMLFSAACGDSTGPGTREGLEFMVGDWKAEALVVVSVADPQESVDLLEGGSTFRINVQPSGQYTATLTVFGSPVTEIGFLALDGSILTLYRQFPSPDTSTAILTQLSPDRVRLVGESAFDFDGNGQNEPAALTTELARER